MCFCAKGGRNKRQGRSGNCLHVARHDLRAAADKLAAKIVLAIRDPSEQLL
jgi:hypothetical protein